MGLIHTDLYGAQRFDEVDMGLHVQHLAEHLTNVYHTEDTDVRLSISASGVRLTLAQAVPSGLILNELITNAYQHAFTCRPTGTIEVTLEELPGRTVLLRVKDDGVGMSAGARIEDPHTIGLQLVKGLADQVEGTVEIAAESGTDIAVRFKIDSSGPET
jgi:two-component sensor histidine kinase